MSASSPKYGNASVCGAEAGGRISEGNSERGKREREATACGSTFSDPEKKASTLLAKSSGTNRGVIERAVVQKIDDQQEFVAWWEEKGYTSASSRPRWR